MAHRLVEALSRSWLPSCLVAYRTFFAVLDLFSVLDGAGLLAVLPNWFPGQECQITFVIVSLVSG
jgi:hypothetical protein